MAKVYKRVKKIGGVGYSEIIVDYHEGQHKKDLMIRYIDENTFICTLYLEDEEITALLNALLEAHKKEKDKKRLKELNKEKAIVSGGVPNGKEKRLFRQNGK